MLHEGRLNWKVDCKIRTLNRDELSKEMCEITNGKQIGREWREREREQESNEVTVCQR